MSEACTAADVRLIKWDNYTIVAIVFMTPGEWCASEQINWPCPAEIVHNSDLPTLTLCRGPGGGKQATYSRTLASTAC